MIQNRDASGEYPDCLISYLGFENYINDYSDDYAIYYGYRTPFNNEILRATADVPNKIFWQAEHPSGLHTTNHAANLQHMNIATPFDVAYTNCPYTCDWLNKYQYKEEKYKKWSFFYDEKWAVQGTPEKKYDVIYWGGVHSKLIAQVINTISKFNYNFCSLSQHSKATHINLPRPQMWELLRSSKIMVIQNMLFGGPNDIAAVKRLPNWKKNEAFKHIDTGLIPQIKTRAIEAAFNKTLMLVRKDPWNTLAMWFEPDVDFIYYENEAKLEDKIQDILNNWDQYQTMIENAYNKAMGKYTTKNFLKKVCK